MSFSFASVRKRLAAAVAATAVSLSLGLVAAAPAKAQLGCSDVEVIFARGTFELPGTGAIVGPAFTNALKLRLIGKSVNVHAVDYAADALQLSAGSGATYMTKRVKSVAAKCPNTKFVLGGYSQGATVTDISIGINTVLGKGEKIPADLAPRVAAVVVYGNPLKLTLGDIGRDAPLYRNKFIDICNAGDPVCAAGINILAHLSYGSDGGGNKGADFAAKKVKELG
jgi:cutinase